MRQRLQEFLQLMVGIACPNVVENGVVTVEIIFDGVQFIVRQGLEEKEVLAFRPADFLPVAQCEATEWEAVP